MAWSTREIAELTGTTLRAVRYYHQVGVARRKAMRELYNPAQLDVLQRARVLLGLPPRNDPT